jgi:hypothetical protein
LRAGVAKLRLSYDWGVSSASVFGILLLSISPHLSLGQTHVASPATEQTDTGIRRFEFGGQVADIRTICIGRVSPCYVPSFGLGGGVTANLNANVALDTTVNVTPSSSDETSNVAGGHALEFLTGVRAEVRAKNYGFFLKAQAGDLTWTKVDKQVIFTPPTFSFVQGSRNLFASNVSAGFEYSPVPRIHLRGEVGDLIVRYGPGGWTNNLQPSLGVYTSVGRPIRWNPPIYDAKATHPFFDKYNDILIAGSLLATTADAVTTQRFLSHGERELDPFARPLVKYGWSGQISLIALETGAEIIGMYGLHRIHHHLIERMIPGCLATVHGILAYDNLQNIR